MSNGRDFPFFLFGNGESCIPERGIQAENGIGQGSWTTPIHRPIAQRVGENLGETPRIYAENEIGQGVWTAAMLGQTPQRGIESLGEARRKYPDFGIGQNGVSWTAAILGGEIPGRGGESLHETLGRPIPMNDRVIHGKEMESCMRTSMGNVVGNRDSRTMVHQVKGNNGSVQNSEKWNQIAMPTTNMLSQGNRNGGSSWTPVTPVKPVPQRSHVVAGDQVGNDKWEDLVGVYKNLLGEKTLNLDKVAQNHYQHYGNQNQVATTAKENLNVIMNPKQYHHLDQASTSVSCMLPEDPANWDCGLLAAMMKPKNSSPNGSYINGPHNHSVHDLNLTPVPELSSEVGSNLVGPNCVGSMNGNEQSPMISGCNSKQVPRDGLPVRNRYCYDLNSPPRFELDAVSSDISPLPFTPITPDTQRRLTDNQWVPAKNGHESQRNEDADNLCIISESSSAVSTTQKDILVSGEGDDLGIDLNKTPNQKTPARRKKHRPKVIREEKPKKSATPKDPKNKTPSDTPVKRKYVRKNQLGNGVEISPNSKRKYVRKKGLDLSDSKQKTQVNEPTPPIIDAPVKSCKKQLNFDLECDVRDVSQTTVNQIINSNDNPQDIEQERRINSILERSAMNVAQKNMYAGVINNQENLRTHMQAGNHTPMAKAPNHAMSVLAKNLIIKNTVSGQDIWRNGYDYLAQRVSNLEGREPGSQMSMFARNLIMENSFMGQDIWRNGYDYLAEHVSNFERESNSQKVNVEDRRGIKRPPLDQLNPRNLNAMEAVHMSQKLMVEGHSCFERSNDFNRMLEIHKKTKMQNSFCTPYPEDSSREEPRQPDGTNGNISASQLVNAHMGRVNSTYQTNQHHSQPPMAVTQSLQKQPRSSGMQPIIERSERSTQGHGINSMTAMVSWKQPPATSPNSRSAVVSYPSTLVEKKRTRTPNLSSQRSNGADKMKSQNHKDGSEVQQISFTKTKGRRKPKGMVSVEDLACMLGALCIYDENDKNKNALVPYKGNNAIIPFEPIKKRKPRPKVDLDPETDRLWRLLMGKEGSEDTETLDKDKEKWWEDERRVFRGRADSFIARMHLVQGDRRFSRWKGSVVDSVIGVFLTQNVSDHLSSSAFMSLAAKFAFKSTSTIEIPSQDDTRVLVEEPTEAVLPSDTMIAHNNIERQPVFNLSSFASCESYEYRRHHNISSTKLAAYQHNKTSEEVILSQDALDLSTIQTVDETRSSSGSNSEAEDQTVGFETIKVPSPVKTLQPERVSVFRELFSHVSQAPRTNDRSQYMHHLLKTPKQTPSSGVDITMSLQNVGSPGFGLLRENIWSLKSGTTDIYDASYLTCQQNNMSRPQVQPQDPQYDFLSNHQNNFLRESHTVGVHRLKVNQPPDKVEGAQKQDSCSENRVTTVDKQNCVEASSKKQNNDSHDLLDRPDKNMPNGKKGNAEDEKKKAFDWDSLRRDVLLNFEKRERSKDAKDSLDYEALRSAHVSEISDAIRERGMNNMLADRIKDFLDRLVRDHGSIDLEWLRDAPPDKAKDYLLSIRGLGLKSVECVRLLTLHHLAFPVDTNVGRIAVRLGWVPLQPLPESLQLHLLEMYPVLESIQKYLWPRLCKLDQLTLYELHYQMITFGKVFCTKSKPNCNACPMRAECRHFASAFASARLALPGPEEMRMVGSDAPYATHTTPPVISRPMPLPPAENNYSKDAQFLCEPIIEEPKTPEPETVELSISDIEDQYYDDDDDIPTIKLDMNEFTMNLQKMQDSMEIQGDMSKALVALNPQAASIPTPKLKNVSRLRTEHQVYELPDSHPILEGLYKREPDDPSHYLLAIWTPGETANSMQPPERGCEAQESGMLCDRTTCFSCNCIREANSQVVRGTILMPCRTAMRGSFPLNGTYFQVNEMFADHASSLNPIEVPRSWIWNLPRRTVYFGTSVSTIFKGLTTQEIQQCFWRGFVCVRGFDQKTRSPRPLMARLHFPASKIVKTKNDDK
uniref:transcriptional activator DEMETER-like n=1 Tax=Erigeron canadensis TaxID=72917 RepID=UPI001CB8BFE3|nr:transcriptional activator DEMETER-like [Erigeron canadensis]